MGKEVKKMDCEKCDQNYTECIHNKTKELYGRYSHSRFRQSEPYLMNQNVFEAMLYTIFLDLKIDGNNVMFCPLIQKHHNAE